MKVYPARARTPGDSAAMPRLTLLLLTVATCFGCNPAQNSGTNKEPSGDKIVVYSSLPRTGSAKGQTDTIVNGIKMAIDEAGGKIGDTPIEYVDLDDANATSGNWSATVEIANANKAASDPNAMVYIGPYNSGAAAESMPILNKVGLLMISPAVTGAGITKKDQGKKEEPECYRPTGKVNFTRVVPADDIQGPLAAQWAKSMGVTKVVVIDDRSLYGVGIATQFRETCREIGVKPIGDQQSIDPMQNDFRSLMTSIKAGEKPDLIYFGGTSQSKAGQIAKDIVAAGLETKLMVPDGCFEPAFISAAGAETCDKLNCFITFAAPPAAQMTGKGKVFVEKYRAKYNTDPEGYAVYGYEAGSAAIAALKKAGKKDRKAVVDAALSIKDFDGVLDKWSFDANGDTTSKSMCGYTIVGGKFQFVKRLDLSESK